MDSADIVVIGAGWYGLVQARTFIELNPSAKVVVLEAFGSVGGVWSKERLYPHLRSNNLWGTFQSGDFPMDEETFGVKAGQPIPGETLHKYLQLYAEKFDVFRRIRFHCSVRSVEKREDGGWNVNYSQQDRESGNTGETEKALVTKKLVIATGLTSQPFIPNFAGSDQYELPIFHARYLHDNETIITESERVAVVGASKSGYDAAYECASAGVGVDWIIRESGHGPVWMAPPFVTPLKKRFEFLVGVRFLTWFSPCIFASRDDFGFARKLLHGTAVGRWLVDGFWKVLGSDVIRQVGFDSHPETKKLKPWAPAFWVATSLSLLNYPEDFYRYVRNGTIKVHVADITHLSPKTVHLSNGESIKADALICSTGWKHRPSIEFLPRGDDGESGLTSQADILMKKADIEIKQRYPRLADQPVLNPKYQPLAEKSSELLTSRPFRLYRFMVPPDHINDRSIAYVGMVYTIFTSTNAQAQALWVNAYFSNRLLQDLQSSKDTPTFDESAVRWQTMLHTRFGKWRYPAGHGSRIGDFVFDSLPYVDMLYSDMGLKWKRKPGLLAELFDPYSPDDYKGIVDEWRIETAKLAAPSNSF